MNLSTLLGRFRPNTEHALLNILQSFKNNIGKEELAGTVFMYLSKTFEDINQDLLVAKLHAYGLSINALQLYKNFLLNRKQTVKIKSAFMNDCYPMLL